MSTSIENKALQTALSKVQRSSSDINQLSHLWPRVKTEPYWWDNYYHVFVTKNHHNIYQSIFGSHCETRSFIKSCSVQNLRKLLSPKRWYGPVSFGLQLPPGTVLLPPIHSKHGLVIASSDAERVLKINYERQEVAVEVENWAIAKSAGITDHVPHLMEHGSTNDGGEWMYTQLSPNTHPFLKPLNPFVNLNKTWRIWLRHNILPTMQRFYEESGLNFFQVGELLDSIKASVKNDNMSEALLNIVRLAEDAQLKSDQTHVIITKLHKDIIPNHIHRHGKQWWILDWGSAGEGLIPKEVFRAYFWTSPNSQDKQPFWVWLRGDISAEQLPTGIRNEIELYLDWYSTWQNTTMNQHSLRCQLLMALLMDYNEVIHLFNLGNKIGEIETASDLPNWVRTLLPQLEILGAIPARDI